MHLGESRKYTDNQDIMAASIEIKIWLQDAENQKHIIGALGLGTDLVWIW